MSEIPAIEEELLGLVLLSPTTYYTIRELVAADDFTHSVTRCVWQAIEETSRRGASFSLPLIESYARWVPEALTLSVYLATLLSNAAEAQDSPVAAADLAEVIADRARRRRIDETLVRARSYLTDDGTTTEEALGKMVADLTRTGSSRVNRFTASLAQLAEAVARRALDPDDETTVRGIGWGVEEIERMVGPMMPGELIVLGAASGVGKTAVAMQIAMHVARTLPVEVFQLEMEGMSVAERQIASETGIAIRRIRSGGMNAAECEAVMEAVKAIVNHKLTLHWMPRQTTAQIRSAVLGSRGRNGQLGLVVVDHNKLVQVEGKVRDRIERIALAMDDMKALAKEADVPVLMLSQMTREGVKRIASGGVRIKELRPHRYDLYGGGDMEEFADLIMLMHRPEIVLEQNEPSANGRGAADDYDTWRGTLAYWAGKAELIAEKVRHGAPAGKIEMRWNGQRTRLDPLPVLEGEWE